VGLCASAEERNGRQFCGGNPIHLPQHPAQQLTSSLDIRAKNPNIRHLMKFPTLIDSRSCKLVYRNFAAGDVARGASATTRAARVAVAVAVAQTLAGFFR